MSDGLNRAMLIGNLCADPELRFTGAGTAVLNIRMATNESWIDKTGTKQERTEFHTITVWDKRAEGLAKILHKGDRIYAEGRIQTTSYEKDGAKRYKTEIVAQDVILCGGGRRADGASQNSGAQTRPARPDPGGYTPPAGGAGVGDDEPPF